MKTGIYLLKFSVLVFSLLLYSFNNVFSQEKKPQYTFSVTGGGLAAVFNEEASVNGRYGLNYSAEFGYAISDETYLLFSYSHFNQSKPSQDYSISYNEYVAGFRYYPLDAYFVDFLYGNYSPNLNNRSGGPFYGIPFSNDDRFGMSFAAGTNIGVTPGYNLLLKLKYNMLFGEETTSFISMNAGVQAVSTAENLYAKKKRYFAVVYGGVYETAHKFFNYGYAGNVSAEFGINNGQWDFMSGLSYAVAPSTVQGKSNDFNSRYSEFYTGARFSLGEGRLKLFVEGGPALYYAETENFGIKDFLRGLGGNIGTGSEVGIYKDLSIILKYKALILFGHSEVFPSFSGGLKLGI